MVILRLILLPFSGIPWTQSRLFFNYPYLTPPNRYPRIHNAHNLSCLLCVYSGLIKMITSSNRFVLDLCNDIRKLKYNKHREKKNLFTTIFSYIPYECFMVKYPVNMKNSNSINTLKRLYKSNLLSLYLI